MRHIISIGGGGFSNPKSDLTIERYILAQSLVKTPKICMLPQASNEDSGYLVKFFETFQKLGAIPTWLSLFGRVENSYAEKLLSQDIIYVGGGNTKSMLALWREWGIDSLLKTAYENGTILCGVSAGAICWFEQCVTDSVWPLGVLSGLGMLSGSCCPHYDTEPERAPAFQAMVKRGDIQPGIALNDFTAAHYINETLHQVVRGSDSANAYGVTADAATRLTL